MKLSFEEVIPELESEKGDKKLDVLEANNIMHTEIKVKIQKKYYRRKRQLISSKLNRGNIVRVINVRDVSLVRYSAGVLKLTKDELKLMNRKTRKIITMNRTQHAQREVTLIECKIHE